MSEKVGWFFSFRRDGLCESSRSLHRRLHDLFVLFEKKMMPVEGVSPIQNNVAMKFPKVGILKLACISMIVALVTPGAHAEVEVLGYWKLGSSQAVAGPKIKGDVIKGEGGSPDLQISGDPVYSSEMPDDAPDLNGSVKFHMGDFLFLDQPLTAETEQFGIEAWVKSDEPTAGRNISLLNNGRGAPGFGYGLLQTEGNNYAGIFNGVTLVESPDRTVPVRGEWTHLAVVRDAEDFGTRFYVNGELVYSSEKRAPQPFSPEHGEGAFVVAGEKYDLGDIKGNFVGNIACVRVFRFQPGTFKSEDLLHGQK